MTELITSEGLHALLFDLVRRGKDLETQVVKSSCSRIRIPSTTTDEEGLRRLETSISQVDKVIHVLDDILINVKTTLRRDRNALININTLPDEILLFIFTQAAERPRWKKQVSAVCSRWRTLCQSSSRFRATFTVPETAEETYYGLLSSAGSHLDLTVDCRTFHPNEWEEPYSDGEEEDEDFPKRKIHLLHENQTRFRQLSVINFFRLTRETRWWGRTLPPWTAVRKLYVDAGTPPSWPDHRITKWTNFAMQELTFVNCRLPYVPGPFLHLHKLWIEYDVPPTHKKDDSDKDGELYCLLSGCPNLVDLVLRHPPVSPREALSLPVTSCLRSSLAPLRALRRLRLDMYVQTIGTVLENILTDRNALSTIDLVVTDMKHWTGSAWNKELLQAGGTLFSMVSPDALPALARMESLSVRYGQRIAGGARGSGHPWHPSTPLRVRVTFGAGMVHDDYMDLAFNSFLEFMVTQSYLSNVRRLELEGYRQYAEVIRILHATPRLETRVLEGTTGPEVLSYIARRRAHSAEQFVPELRTVTLTGSVLSEEFVETLPALVDALRPCVIYLERCQSTNGYASIVEKLLQDGMDVRWDGAREDIG